MTVEDAPIAPVPQERSLLKAHKALPRKPQEQQPTYGVEAIVSPQGHRSSFIDHRNSDPSLRSNMVLEDPMLPATGAIALPPTPPKNPFDSSDGNTGLGLHVRKTRGMKFPQSPGSSTPRNQRSPPTPDITPPREPLKPSVFDQSHSKRVPSSRTESFSTAREHQPLSDEETGGLPSHSANLTRNSSANASRSASIRDFSLGLGIKSDEEAIAARDRNGRQTFLNFDGGWGDKEDPSGMDWNDELMKNVTVRKKKGAQSCDRVSRDEFTDPFTSDGDKFDIQTMRGLNLEKRIDLSGEAKDAGGMEDFTKHTSFATGHAGPPDADDRRFSSISMVVEAMVVDTAPQIMRTLRHTSKKSQLRDLPLDLGRSVSNPEAQGPLQGRKNSKSLGKPRRTVSDAAASVGSSGRSQQDIIPVVVIPERRSSLSAPTSKSTRTYSLTAASVQTRTLPTSAPRRRRTLSDSTPSVSRFDMGWERDFNPVIPQRRSSLSAPTSRNVSRATSLTSESTKPPGDQLHIGPADVQPPRRWSSYVDAASQDDQYRSGNEPRGPPLKKLVSPGYSQFPETSQTPEVIEATAVSIFPHNNESILVVQQSARNTSSSLPSNPPTTAPETPPTKHPEVLSMESPLKNPRKPPPPPAFKVIPPTPQTMTPAEELNRQLPGSIRPSTASGSLFGGPLSHVRRALSNRKRPESIATTPVPVPRGVDGSTQTEDDSPGFCRPSLSEASRQNSKLHPFWKPRGFWDDLDDLDDDDYVEEYPSQRNSAPISTSGGSSTGKRISFSVPDKVEYNPLQLSLDSLSIQKNQKTRRAHRIPGLGLEFEYIGWQGIQRRIKEVKARREHEAKERKRSRLRQQIGAPKAIVKSIE
ncbi:MAG: hypothetical protein M1840_008187 [Geoglossum simile]|nr:MAG: hypothetical protein M1840_008187 [Geoglossum simile]